jgi:hypothetical protein
MAAARIRALVASAFGVSGFAVASDSELNMFKD